MRVMVLADASFAQREHRLLTRLEIGLADDGATVLHAIPSRCSADILGAFSSTIVKYDDAATPIWRSARARQLLAAAREALDTPDLRVDVVHVFGRGAWSLGEAVVRECGAAPVFEVWRADLIDDAMALARRRTRSAPSSPFGLLTSSQLIADQLTTAGVRAGSVGVAAWGVPASDSARPPIDPSAGMALSVLAEGATGAETAELRAMLEGAARALRRTPNLLMFLDGTAADRPQVWRAARRLGLLDRATAVAEMEARREPILQTDILVMPEPMGVCRTLPLAAMAEGLSLIARPDAYHAAWLNERTSRLVGAASRPPTPEEWERAIIDAIENTTQTASLRNAARSFLREERTVSAYIAGVQRLYDEVLKRAERAVTA